METIVSLPVEMDAAHRRHFLGGEPIVFHCHHYNTFLQRSIQDAHFIDSDPFLIGAAAEVAFAQLTSLIRQEQCSNEADRRELAERVYSWSGFGTLDFSGLTVTGGVMTTPNSHYAAAWNAKWGAADRPVCLFTSGWISGAMSAIHDRPLGDYHVDHPSCLAMDGTQRCAFDVTATPASYTKFEAVGAGNLTDHGAHPFPCKNVDSEGVYNAVTSMPLVGDATGSIPAFGVYLTHHYANYYNRIGFEMLHNAIDQFGDEGRDVVQPLLVEAGHVCAFNTFGGIMKSSEWDALIAPSLETPEDWVHGIVAVVNSLGWGRWQATEVSKHQATFVVQDDYESVGYRAMYGNAKFPCSYLAQGAAAGIMNLVYKGDIQSRPELTPEFYRSLFRSHDAYAATPLKSRAMGDDVTSFRVARV